MKSSTSAPHQTQNEASRECSCPEMLRYGAMTELLRAIQRCLSHLQATVSGRSHLAAPIICRRTTQTTRRGCIATSSRRCNAKGHQETVYQAILKESLALEEGELREWLCSNRQRVSLDFLLWLSDREREASGEEKAKLDRLGGHLTFMREGLDSEVCTQMLENLQRAAVTALVAPEEESNTYSATEVRQLERSRQRLQDNLSISQLSQELERATLISHEIGERKAESIAQVIGRAPAELAAAERGLNAAAAADRILEALLAVPEKELRLAMLPEAFTRPTSATEASNGEELLFTTPLQLLQAVVSRLKRLQNQGDSEPSANPLLLGASSALDPQERKIALTELKEAILQCWDAP